eukprot:UN21177
MLAICPHHGFAFTPSMLASNIAAVELIPSCMHSPC